MAASDLRTPSRVTKRKARIPASKKCLAGDGKLVHARGLCGNCYREVMVRVSAKEITWEELEKQGLAKPKFGRAGASAIAKKIASLKKRGTR